MRATEALVGASRRDGKPRHVEIVHARCCRRRSPDRGPGQAWPVKPVVFTAFARAKAVKTRPDLLAPVYGWFTEGFDTLDLKEAKALLAELA